MRWAILLLYFVLALPTFAEPPPTGLSVQVDANGAKGSGVPFVRGDTTFIWTCGHVVNGLQTVKQEVDPATGQPRTYIRYDDVRVVVDEYQDNRMVGTRTHFAKIIRFSDYSRGGEDLALLVLYRKKSGFQSATLVDSVPAAGESLWCVGGAGTNCNGQVAPGCFSTAGRLGGYGGLHNKTHNAKIFDSITASALGGHSGGGVFLKDNAKCIGLLAIGVDNSEGINLVIPARRMREYAKRTDCLWALEQKGNVPDDFGGESKITDRPVELTAPQADKKTAPLLFRFFP